MLFDYTGKFFFPFSADVTFDVVFSSGSREGSQPPLPLFWVKRKKGEKPVGQVKNRGPPKLKVWIRHWFYSPFQLYQSLHFCMEC